MAKKVAEAEAVIEMPQPAEEIVESIKGFDANLKCRDFQFEIGKTYDHAGPVKACSSGFHAIEGHPLEVFGYYPPATSRYAIVKQSGQLARHDNDSKVASAKITIEAEIALPALIERAAKWMLDRVDWSKKEGASGNQSAATNTGYQSAATNTGDRSAATNTGYQSAATNTGDQSAATNTGNQSAATNTGYRSAATNTGYRSAATNTGDQSVATNTGDRSAATNTGDRSAATNTGNQSAATNTGDRSAATAEGKHNVALACGHHGRARGADGCALFLVHRDPSSGEIKHAWAGIVGRDGIKPMQFYCLDDNGKPQECT